MNRDTGSLLQKIITLTRLIFGLGPPSNFLCFSFDAMRMVSGSDRRSGYNLVLVSANISSFAVGTEQMVVGKRI